MAKNASAKDVKKAYYQVGTVGFTLLGVAAYCYTAQALKITDLLLYLMPEKRIQA